MSWELAWGLRWEGWDGDQVTVGGTVCCEPAPRCPCSLGHSRGSGTWGSRSSSSPPWGPFAARVGGADVTLPAEVGKSPFLRCCRDLRSVLSNKFKACSEYLFKTVHIVILDAKKSLPSGWYFYSRSSKASTPAASNNCS